VFPTERDRRFRLNVTDFGARPESPVTLSEFAVTFGRSEALSALELAFF
jgi:hypothetical protein